MQTSSTGACSSAPPPLSEPWPRAPQSFGRGFSLLIIFREESESSREGQEARHVAIQQIWRAVTETRAEEAVDPPLLCFHASSRDDDERLLVLSDTQDGAQLLEKVALATGLEKRTVIGDYAEFSDHAKLQFAPGPSAFFTSLERQRLLYRLIDSKLGEQASQDERCFDSIGEMLQAPILKDIMDVIPLHDGIELELLYSKWFGSSFWPLWHFFPSPLFWLPLVDPRFDIGADTQRSTLVAGVAHEQMSTTIQPLDEVRDYFGEKIALYFAFMESVTRDLMPLAALGLFMAFSSGPQGSASHPLMPFYSVFVVAWIAWVQKNWTRQCKRLAFHWNAEDFEEEERDRRHFTGDPAFGFYTPEGYWVDTNENSGTRRKRFYSTQRMRRVLLSYTCIGVVIGCLAVLTVAMLAFRSILMAAFFTASWLPAGWRGEKGAQVGASLGGVFLSFFVSLTNVGYTKLAIRLNDWENHRTPTDYEDALILKNMFFKFINSYAALMYTAFIKAQSISLMPGVSEYCHSKETFGMSQDEILRHYGSNPFCMNELSTLLTSLVVTSQITGILSDLLLPFVSAWRAAKNEEDKMRKKAGEGCCSRWGVPGFHAVGLPPPPPLSFAEHQAKRQEFAGVNPRYGVLIIQLGYIVLFAPAFPIAAAVTYVFNLVRLRGEAFLLLKLTQRPLYAGAEDIGSWDTVLNAITILGVMTNVGIVGITSSHLRDALPMDILGVHFDKSDRVLLLVLAEHLTLILVLLLKRGIPDISRDLSIAKALATGEKATKKQLKRGKRQSTRVSRQSENIPT